MADTTTMHISLPKTMKSFVDDTLKREGYGTTSEYVKALIRADQKRREEKELERVLIQALHTGDAEELTEGFWDDLKQDVRKRAVELKKRKK